MGRAPGEAMAVNLLVGFDIVKLPVCHGDSAGSVGPMTAIICCACEGGEVHCIYEIPFTPWTIVRLISRTSMTHATIRTSFVALVVLVLHAGAAAQSPVPPGAVVEKLATGYLFVEGPVWDDSIGVLFSDMNGNKVIRWTESGGASDFLNPSSNANGLAYDSSGRLLLNQTGLRRVARREGDGTIVPLATSYGGKKLNSPNDLVVKSDGAVFFTDPPFNIPAGQHQELSFSGIYRISPSGALQLLDSTLLLPNGICFSPDESKLYVDESQQRIIYVWDVVNDSVIANKRVFANINPMGYADGMKVDAAGNLYCAGPLGIWVFGPTGSVLDTILVAETPSNCNWGGADRKTLFITAGKSLYRIRIGLTGIEEHTGSPEGGFQLFQNYPNPFNPRTVVSGQLSVASRVRLTVYDLLGREVETLLDGQREAGSFRVEFDGTRLSSGVYVCRATEGSFTQSRTMLLLR
jgi:gluconolactonase